MPRWPTTWRGTLLRAVGLLAVFAGFDPARADPAAVHNYDASEAGTSGPVWAIAQVPDGTLFVGSNRLGVHNGRDWETLDIPEAYAFRALAVATGPRREKGEREQEPGAGRVWVGAIGAIGYLEKQAAGNWAFVSLARDLQAAGVHNPGDIWQAYAMGRGAVFITTNRVLRWDGKAFETWPMPSKPHLQSFRDGPDVLVYQNGRGLWRVRAADQPMLEIPDHILPARPVTWFSSRPTSDDEEKAGATLLGLGTDAYRLVRRADAGAGLSETRFERIENLGATLRNAVPSYAEWIDPELLAIGTYRAGVVIIDKNGRIRTRIDRAAGLDNDNVTALQSDGAGRLWIGHGSGFVRVDGPGRTTLFNHRSMLGPGHPQSVVVHEATAYVLTSRGFFRAETPPQDEAAPSANPSDTANSATRFVPLLEPKEMLHAATVIAGQIWICGFGGIWRITPEGAQQEYYSATDVLQLAAHTAQPGEVLFLDGYELKALRPTKHGWASRGLEAHVQDTPVSLLDIGDEPGGAASGVWVSTVKDGIYRFAWSRHPTARQAQGLRLVSHYRPGRGLPQHTKNPRLTRCGARLYAFTETEVLALVSDGRAFEPVAEMAEFSGVVAAYASHLEPKGKSDFWLVQSRALTGFGTYGLLRVEGPDSADGRLALHPVELAGLDHAGRPTAAAVVADSDGTALWVAGTEAVLRVDIAHLRPAVEPPPARFLAIRTDDKRRSVVSTPGSPHQPIWETATKRVTFSYTTPRRAGGEPAFFQTRLSGVETGWSAPAREMSREFAGLGHRKYVFDVRALDRFGRAGASAAYAFAIAPPWFVTWPAFAGYGALALGGIASLMRWRMVRLRRQNEKLNRLVAERTRELELSNTVRAEFLENISHEIRNPLNGLNGLLGLLGQAKFARPERELMESLRGCARNLNRTYEEVLGFSKLEYGYITKEEQPFALRQLLQEIVDGFKWLAAQQNCPITVEWPECSRRETGDGEQRTEDGRTAVAPAANGQGDDSFIGDANKIRTIVSNFVGNALNYAPEHPVEIKVELQPVDDGHVSASIDVCDHGPGIPPEEQGLIFQKFVRGSNAKSGKIAGTGLGLATCRVMAKALGGSVGVESDPGRGSVFFVRMPLKRAGAAVMAANDRTMPAAGAPDTPNSARALIVEDEPYNQTVLQGIVLQLGYTPAVASNAGEAAALLNVNSFAIVLLDWELPGVKGGDIARYVRSRPQGEQPVIIATTGHDSEEMRRRCRECGMDDFLLKPYDLEAIRRCIARVLERRGGGNRGGSPMFSGGATTPMRPANPQLNLRAFDHYAAGAPEKARHAARDFVAALDKELAALERAVAAADGERIARHAHHVRALGGLLAAIDFTQAAHRLEMLAGSGSDGQRLLAFHDLMNAGKSLKSRLAAHLHPAPAEDA